MSKLFPNKFTIVLWICLIVSIAGNIHLVFRAKDYRRGANEWLDKYTYVVDEYSKLSVYHDSDQSLKSDSIVDGRIVLYGTQVAKRWDAGKYLHDWQIVNRGVVGQWSSGLLLRFYQDVAELKPEYVLIEVSSYNLRPRFPLEMIKSHVKSMVDIALSNGIKPILTTMIPQLEGYDNFDDYSVMSNLTDYDKWIKEYAHSKNIKLLNMNALLKGNDGYLQKNLSNAAIDPNEQGYDILSKALIKLLGD